MKIFIKDNKLNFVDEANTVIGAYPCGRTDWFISNEKVDGKYEEFTKSYTQSFDYPDYFIDINSKEDMNASFCAGLGFRFKLINKKDNKTAYLHLYNLDYDGYYSCSYDLINKELKIYDSFGAT
jgi:hypothetical protein